MGLFTRILGWGFALATLAVAGWEALADDRAAGLRAAGELWYQLHVGSLNLAQAVVERYLWPPLWDPGISTVLQWPAIAVFGVPAVVLLALGYSGRLRRRNRIRFK